MIDDAHARGLIVHGWTFRAENQFLPAEYRSSADPNALGDMAAEVRRLTDGRGVHVAYDGVGASTREASLDSLRRP